MTDTITRRSALQGLAASSLVCSTFHPARAAPANAGEYTGKLKPLPDGCIALSSDGEHVVVYLCDGSDTHPPTVSHWMRGEIVSGSAQIAAGGFTLTAQWQLEGRRAAGTLTLPNGTALPFVAHNHWPDGSHWGVYRSEEQFNGVTYVGGWIAKPSRHADASPSSDLDPVSWSPVPAMPGPFIRTTFEDDVDDDWPGENRGGVINKQTGAVLPYVAPNLATMTADVPGLGTFRLHRCVQAKCA